jgi:hypothetical protein
MVRKPVDKGKYIRIIHSSEINKYTINRRNVIIFILVGKINCAKQII